MPATQVTLNTAPLLAYYFSARSPARLARHAAEQKLLQETYQTQCSLMLCNPFARNACNQGLTFIRWQAATEIQQHASWFSATLQAWCFRIDDAGTALVLWHQKQPCHAASCQTFQHHPSIECRMMLVSQLPACQELADKRRGSKLQGMKPAMCCQDDQYRGPGFSCCATWPSQEACLRCASPLTQARWTSSIF